MNSEDWGFCKQALQRFSRTFAVPIALLPPSLERTITCAYLLCRIADTIEDTAEWTEEIRDYLFRDFLDVLSDRKPVSEFVEAVERAGGAPEELELLLQTERVFAVFKETDAALRRTCLQWIGELTLGMVVYGRRKPGRDGIRCLLSASDLDRYCYFVAGAIGHLLTESFVNQIEDLTHEQEMTLRQNAERFGAGLQLVNILRDIQSDLIRRSCFIPRTLLDAQTLSPAELSVPERSEAAGLVLTPLFERARAHLDASLEYALAIPSSARGIRQFCLVPLWLAVETLTLCSADPKRLLCGDRVKLPRERVTQLVRQCVALTTDNDGLRAAYAGLRSH